MFERGLVAPRLIFGYGNPSRGDDALGPALLDRIEAAIPAHPEWGEVALLTDYQLQPEHALDLEGRVRILFIDASASCPPPFLISKLAPVQDASHTTHAMSPAALLAVFRQVTGRAPPPAYLLAVRGVSFELGEPLSDLARTHLEEALNFVGQFLRNDWQPIG